MTPQDVLEFERLAYGRDHEGALRTLLRLIDEIDRNYGGYGAGVGGLPQAGSDGVVEADLTRLAAAITALFADPELTITNAAVIRLVTGNQWIASIFQATPFGNTDHILRTLAEDGRQISGPDILKFAALYTRESLLDLAIDELHESSPRLAVSIGMSMVGAFASLTPVALRKKHTFLSWLPARIDRLETLDGLPLGTLHQALMNCSYADHPGKHDIKRSLNRLVRRDLVSAGFSDIASAPPVREKPVMLVVLDWWTVDHAMYRCYSRLVAACRQYFRLVALVTCPDCVDKPALAMFDDLISFRKDVQEIYPELHRLLPAIAGLAPDTVYFPALGMGLHGVFLSNLRLAPLQVASLGHPATPAAVAIDWVFDFPEFHGSTRCFFEPVRMLPPNSFCFAPPPPGPRPTQSQRTTDEPVRIAVPASIMKLNPDLFEACRSIAARARTPVEFRFFVGHSRGISFLNARHCILDVLPGALTFPSRSFGEYVASLAECDMFLSPFPFGNTNGIVDCVRLGLPGVCLHGEQPHAAIDRGMFRIVGLPDELVAHSQDEYIEIAANLVDDHGRRLALHRYLLEADVDARLAAGRPEGLAESVIELLRSTR